MHCNRSSSVGTCSRAGHARRLLPPNNICAAHPTKATNSRDTDDANDGAAVACAAKNFCKLYSAWSRSRKHRKRIANTANASQTHCKRLSHRFAMRLAGACTWRRCSDDRARDITVSGGQKAATPRDMTAIGMQSTALVSIKCAAQLPTLPRCWLALPSLSASCIRLGHDRAASADASQTCAMPAAFLCDAS